MCHKIATQQLSWKGTILVSKFNDTNALYGIKARGSSSVTTSADVSSRASALMALVIGALVLMALTHRSKSLSHLLSVILTERQCENAPFYP
jgi:hypothetical protein